jgi:hypothetical protein
MKGRGGQDDWGTAAAEEAEKKAAQDLTRGESHFYGLG